MNSDSTAMEDLLQFLYLMPVGVVKFRADGTVAMMNPMSTSLLLSITPAESLTNIYSALMPLLPGLQEVLGKFGGPAGVIIDKQWLRARAGGAALVVSLTVNKIQDDTYMAVLADVTRLAEQERALYADRQKFFAIFDHVRDYAIYTITLDGVVDEWNLSLERYGGWRAEDVQGHNIEMFFPADDPERPAIKALLSQAKAIGSIETEGWRVRRDGSRLWANAVITALPDLDGTVRGFVVVSRDITERKRLEDNMKTLATVDPLTGAYNRRRGDVLLDEEFARHRRFGRPFALLMLDIDGFKLINDRYGHLAGDAVLRAMVEACQAVLRVVDMLVRWGGEEFLIILPDTDAETAVVAAERVRVRLAETAVDVTGGTSIRFTVSIGIAVPNSDSPAELVHRSDTALYAAKNAGRNRVVLAK